VSNNDDVNTEQQPACRAIQEHWEGFGPEARVMQPNSRKSGRGPFNISRMERAITMPTVQRLAELAEIYQCGIDELLIASSNRTSDQAELISQILQTLPEADRAMIVEVVQKIAARLKDRL